VRVVLIYGLLTALMWTNSNLCSARSVRYIPQYSVVAWVTLVGLIVTIPFAVIGGVPAGLTAGVIAGLSLVGVCVVVGLVFLYGAFRVGKVSVVSPIAAAEGAVAAVLAGVFGEPIGTVRAAMLVLIVVGVVLSALAPDPAPIDHEQPIKAAVLAFGSACFFGLGIFLTGRFSADLPLAWVLMVPRIAGCLVLFVPLLVTGKLQLTRSAVPFVSATGVSEVLGYFFLGLGSRLSIAITAVMASQVATFTVLGGRILFGERLGRLQILGIVIVITGVTGLALVGAR
jgi:drug/metabolite transporter (DMT)-like permease